MTDEELMRAALDEAKIAADLGEVPVGAVVAKDGEIVARAHNLRESGKNATYHAELIAIDAACKALGGWRLWQCELFVTLEPCPMCSGAIINSRLKRVVYGARDPKAGCCGSLTDLFALPFNHHPVIEGRGAGPAAEFFCDAAGKTQKEIAPFSLAPSGRGLRPQAVGERASRSSEIFRAMARLSPSAPSGHLPPRGRQASGQ